MKDKANIMKNKVQLFESFLDVHSVGTTVALLESLDAKIVTIAIHEDNFVTYECAWWSGESRTKDWFSASDFISIGEKAAVTKIGFKRCPDE